MRWISYFGFTIETFEPLVRLNYVVVFRCFLFLFFFSNDTLYCRFSGVVLDNTAFLLILIVACKSKFPKLQVQSNMLATDLIVSIPSSCFREVSRGGKRWCPG